LTGFCIASTILRCLGMVFLKSVVLFKDESFSFRYTRIFLHCHFADEIIAFAWNRMIRFRKSSRLGAGSKKMFPATSERQTQK